MCRHGPGEPVTRADQPPVLLLPSSAPLNPWPVRKLLLPLLPLGSNVCCSLLGLLLHIREDSDQSQWPQSQPQRRAAVTAATALLSEERKDVSTRAATPEMQRRPPLFPQIIHWAWVQVLRLP